MKTTPQQSAPLEPEVEQASDAQRIRSAAEAVIDEWDTRGDGGCSRSIRDALREAIEFAKGYESSVADEGDAA